MEYKSYSVYRGLQKPLEFMGLKGRYVYIVGGSVSGAILLFIAGILISGFWLALILSSITLSIGAFWVLSKQKKGLHSKSVRSGIYYVTHLMKIE